MLIAVIYLLAGVPSFISLVTLLHFLDCPSHLKKFALAAFVFSVPAIFFLFYAAYLNQTSPTGGGYGGLTLFFRFGLPSSALSSVLYVIVRAQTDRSWGNELLAAVGSLILGFVLPLLIVG
ncbi:MAG: hypothetical protein EAZ40_15215 [Rhodobacterales bacterium]|nr:MAG: hypothetical protein EAZ40_15215 [Rhodobacterales bacterium]